MKSASLGQNFLVNRGVAEKIVDSFLPSGRDIIEVGAGEGVLTKLIINGKGSARFSVVELDSAIACKIEKIEGVDLLLNKDVLKTDPVKDLKGEEFDLISNVPYYISKDFVSWVIKWRKVIKSGVLMFQKEFVDKLLKQKGTPQSLAFNLMFESCRIMNVMPGSFSPPPKVVSTVIKFETVEDVIPDNIVDEFLSFLSAGFLKKRKTLMNNLSSLFDKEQLIVSFDKNGIDRSVRAENMESFQMLKIFTDLKAGSIDNPA